MQLTLRDSSDAAGHVQDITIEYATALTQSAMDRTSTGKAGKLQAEDVLFVVRKVRTACPSAPE